MTKFSKSEIAEKVSAIIVDKLGVNKEEVVPDAYLTDLGADSLDVVELGMEVDTEFDILLNDADVDELNSVQDLIDLVTKMVN